MTTETNRRTIEIVSDQQAPPAHNVASLHGGAVQTGEPNAGCVAKLEELLERARSGDITGIACAALHSDNTASTAIAGMVGPYSLLGAVDMAHRDLQDIMKARG